MPINTNGNVLLFHSQAALKAPSKMVLLAVGYAQSTTAVDSGALFEIDEWDRLRRYRLLGQSVKQHAAIR